MNNAITYRKTQSGEWVAFGPAASLRAGTDVTVSKRDGSTKLERIARVGRPFAVAGVEMAYGYIDRDQPQVLGSAMARRGQPRSRRCDCGEGWATVTIRDGSGLSGEVCRRCAANPMTVSFA